MTDTANVGSDDRVQLEAFIADCAARFTETLAPDDIDREIEHALRGLARVIKVDRCALLGGVPGGNVSWVTCAVATDGGAWPLRAEEFAARFPWLFHNLCGSTRPVAVADLADLPDDAEPDRQSAQALGVRAMLVVVVREGSAGTHCLMMQSLRETRAWPSHYVARLPVLARVFVNALARKFLEETRQQVETRHADLLESVGAIVWRADPSTFQTTFVSREAEAILGYPLESWIKVQGFWRDHVHPDDRSWVEALTTKAIQEHRKHDFEYRMVVADGRIVWLRNIVNVRVENGRPIELIGVTVDITERKRAEFETARLREQLGRALRVTSLGELAATIAHELNQPLGAIVSNAETGQVLLNRVLPPVDALRAILGDIAEDGQRAGAVLHRVRMLLQKQALEMQPLDLTRLVEGMVGVTRALALSRQITLSAELPPDLPPVCGDAVQIQQVLLNLIFNAIDAVSVRPADARRVAISAAIHEASTVELAVADTGTGIPADMLSQVFDPFFTTKTSGMGMGLAICRTIVQSHGGDMRVENNADGGATVRFTLPQYETQEESRDEAAPTTSHGD